MQPAIWQSFIFEISEIMIECLVSLVIFSTVKEITNFAPRL